MSTGKRVAALALLVVVAVVAFIVVSSGDDDAGDDGVSRVATNTTESRTTTTQGGTNATPGTTPPAVTTIRVRNGQPVGGVQKISVNKGDGVRLVVVSDVADEVHVHGYDLTKEVEAGGTARFSFRADIDGAFEIELEDRQEQIASLEVEP